MRVGSAELAAGNSLLVASDGIILIVDSILLDYGNLNTSTIEAGEKIMGIGPFSTLQVKFAPAQANWMGLNKPLLSDKNTRIHN